MVSGFVTPDGVMEAQDKWSFEFLNEESMKFKFDELFASGALLPGRMTYQIFAAAWPSLTYEENLKLAKDAGGDAEAIRVDMGKGNPFGFSCQPAWEN